ncbi:MAG TPA: hypothetical protein VF101_07750 [Gaiellaceae bacterium]
MRAVFETPRPVPSRTLPTLGGLLVIALALPVFLIAGWRVAGWALAAVLWIAVQGLELLLARLKARTSNLAASGVQAFGLFFKAIGLLVVLLAAAATDRDLAIGAALTYALAYTFQLGLSLIAYFSEAPR